MIHNEIWKAIVDIGDSGVCMLQWKHLAMRIDKSRSVFLREEKGLSMKSGH